MNRPKLLDLFCCEGGAAVGYDDAGFDVYGVDNDPNVSPRYPYAIHIGDALDVLRRLIAGEMIGFEGLGPSDVEYLTLNDFAAIHASPPCQAHSTITPDPSKHEDLIPPTRELLLQIEQPWVMENVEGAKGALIHPMKLCGSAFGLKVRRHRLFESNVWLTSVPCDHGTQGRPIGVYGDHPQDDHEYRRPDGTRRGAKARDVDEASFAMGGMPWASWHGLTQAIPPAFSEWIGSQLLAVVKETTR